MLKEIIVFVLIAYIVSRVLRFVLPIFRITSAANSQMRNMQEQMQAKMQEMQNQMHQQQGSQQNQQPKFRNEPKKEKEGDYIDYEELPPTP